MYASGTGYTEVADRIEDFRAEVGLNMLIYFLTIFYPHTLPPPVHV